MVIRRESWHEWFLTPGKDPACARWVLQFWCLPLRWHLYGRLNVRDPQMVLAVGPFQWRLYIFGDR